LIYLLSESITRRSPQYLKFSVVLERFTSFRERVTREKYCSGKRMIANLDKRFGEDFRAFDENFRKFPENKQVA